MATLSTIVGFRPMNRTMSRSVAMQSRPHRLASLLPCRIIVHPCICRTSNRRQRRQSADRREQPL